MGLLDKLNKINQMAAEQQQSFAAKGLFSKLSQKMENLNTLAPSKSSQSPESLIPEKNRKTQSIDTIIESMDLPEKYKNLVYLTLEDGEITEKERVLLLKKGEEYGLDGDTLDFFIDKLEEKLGIGKEEAKVRNNPVNRISEAFALIGKYLGRGGYIDGKRLSLELSQIPEIGSNSTIISLASSLSSNPRNVNALKAEIINKTIIPDDEQYIADFIQFCELQKKSEKEKENSKGLISIFGDVFADSSMDLIPLWEEKIKHLIDKAKNHFSGSRILEPFIEKYSLIPSLKRKKSDDFWDYVHEVRSLSAPEDDTELLQLVALLYEDRKEVDGALKKDYKKMYDIAEKRFAGNPQYLAQLSMYKEKKKFGLF